jgi:hypothetical protein
MTTRAKRPATLGGGAKWIVRNILGRVHVGVPEDEAVAAVLAKVTSDDPAFREAVAVEARKVHAENRDLYNRVMSGRF